MSTSVSLSLQRTFALIVTLALALGLLTPMLAPARTRAASAELFFSEYIEGSSNNKALEIYNGTGAAVDLAAGGYNVQMYFNGNASAGLTINLTGTVADGDVFVLAQSSASAMILAQADQTNGAGWYNGDDAVVLRKGTTVVDSIGQVPFDPGSEWGTGLTGTADNTLRRKDAIEAGDPNASDAFDPAVEWDGYATDTFDGLGARIGSPPPPAVTAVINEFSANTVSGPDVEYVELFGEPDTDLSSLAVIELEGDSGAAAGTIDRVIQAGTTDSNGFWLANLPDGALENGTMTLLLVRGSTGAAGTDLDTDNDGVLDLEPWGEIVDAVAVTDGGAGDVTYGTPTLAPGYDGGSFTVGGASRIPNGEDNDAAGDWVRNDFDLAGIPGYVGSKTDGEAYNTPGTANSTTEAPVPPPSPIGECADPADLIHDVQGSGLQSPLAGTQVIVEGIVVGDFQYGSGTDSGDLGGFFLQEEDADADADPLTSEAIFVYDPNGTAVQVGDQVRVGGTVSEFGSDGSLMTELTNVIGLDVCANGATVPTATEVTLPVTDVSDFERYEGMLVAFPQALTISEYFNFDRFNEVVLSDGRQFQPTAVADPGSPEAAAIAAANRLGRITLDDGRTNQNPVPLRHPDGDPFTLDHRFRGGDTVQNVTGVIEDSHGLYRIQPTAGADYTAVNPRPAAPADVGGRIIAASFNVLNYFTTLDDGTNDICGPAQDQECRGADDAGELARQRAKIVAALATMDADVVGLMEIENNPGDVPTADLVAGLNDALGAGTYAYVETGAIGTDAIRLALIYKPGSVTPVGEYAILDASVDPRFDDDKSRPALAQTFAENATGAEFTMVVNHLKSKGSACGAGDDDPEQGNCNLTRTEAAQALVDWLATDPTGAGDVDALIMGDLNSYDHEDPITAIRAGADDTSGTGDDFTDLVRQYAGEGAYSYVFDGMIGYLDTALASPTIQSQVTGTTIWHINADEPDVLDYDTSFKPAGQEALYAPDAYRSSDHDPVLVGLDLLAYDFDGFGPPVGGHELSDVPAGRALPLKFSLGGDFGLDVLFEPPQVFACDAWPLGPSEDAASTGPLTYDPAADQYEFVWKTSRDWAGDCRLIELTLVDGTRVTVEVSFADASGRASAARR